MIPLTEILQHLESEYPREGCGVLLNKRGKLVYIPCKNVADSPEEEFRIDAKEYLSISLSGDIYAIVHSHCDTPEDPSDWDIKASEFLKIPYFIFSLPSRSLHVYEPSQRLTPLLGRQYEFGKNDCYSIVRDYYLEHFGIKLNTMLFEDDFWEKGINYFEDLQTSYGFYEVKDPLPGDLIIFSVISDIPNHCGVYLGNNLFLHHAVDRLSCRESIYSFWGKYITRYLRCKDFT